MNNPDSTTTREKRQPEPPARLKPLALFYTPSSIEELEHYISRFSGSEACIAVTVMGMTWNLCAKLTKPEPATEESE